MQNNLRHPCLVLQVIDIVALQGELIPDIEISLNRIVDGQQRSSLVVRLGDHPRPDKLRMFVSAGRDGNPMGLDIHRGAFSFQEGGTPFWHWFAGRQEFDISFPLLLVAASKAPDQIWVLLHSNTRCL